MTNLKSEPQALFAIAATQVNGTTRILRLPDVMDRVGLRRASIYQHMASGTFPKPIALGIRARGWLEHEIDAWIAVRVQARPHA